MPQSQGQIREQVLKVGGALAMWEEPLLVGDYSCCCGQSQEGGHAHEFKESPNRRQVSFPECGDKRLGRDILRKSVQSRICSRSKTKGFDIYGFNENMLLKCIQKCNSYQWFRLWLPDLTWMEFSHCTQNLEEETIQYFEFFLQVTDGNYLKSDINLN